ncbi:LANO_0H04170g1_1 [Lachancea nothofagi CBS 11611]|uniref:LANO_0H04170g1_1 n=1 Tax=Lachancea nothofagi CBS 11611 TaxID=1266666 RepID=A0A1G4KL63_9SACH|nr:LANO_0H04170g1_1 [Lachancea nothofagi CBS 11611]
MNKSISKDFKYIQSPSGLSDLFSEGEVISQNIEFVSVLTGIDFDPKSRCLLLFKNFHNSEKSEADYIGRITCNTPDTLNLTKMTLSLFSQQFDFDFPELDNESGFTMDDVHLEKLCFVFCKGTFISCGDKGGIFLQGLRAIDLHASLFNATEEDKKTLVYESTRTIFDNLVKINSNSKELFKFVKLQNLTNEMRQYFQARQESISIWKEKNPIFGLSRFHDDCDSLNDFDSQAPDTNPTFNSQQYCGPSKTAIHTREKSSNSHSSDSIQRSELTHHTKSIEKTTEARAIERDPISPRDIVSVHTAGLHNNSEDISLCVKKSDSSVINMAREDSLIDSDDSVLSNRSMDTQPVDKRRHSKVSHAQPTVKKIRTSEPKKIYQQHATDVISSASSDEVVTLEGKIVGVRINHISTPPSVAIYCQADSMRVADNSGLLCVNNNCIEIMANVTDNIKCNTTLLEASTSTELLRVLRSHIEDKFASITVKKTPVILANGYFTFSLSLRSLRVEPSAITSHYSRITPRSSQVVVSSCESSQELLDPLKTFSEISVTGNQVEFIRTFGLLVSAKSFGRKMTKFVFTDFTSHHQNKLSAFDSFLGSYTDRLPQDMAFPFVIYNDHYSVFARQIKQKTGIALTDCFNGNDNNLTPHGIVCRLEVKVKIYAGGIDGIIRTCEPIINGDATLRADEKAFLDCFYRRSIEKIPQYLLVSRFNSYEMFFPITMFRDLVVLEGESVHDTCSTVSTPRMPGELEPIPFRAYPTLRLDGGQFTVVRDLDVAALHSINKLSNTVLYQVRAKVVGVFQSKDWLVFYLTNDLISQDMLDPKRILLLDIPGAENVAYFLGCSNSQTVSGPLRTHLHSLIVGQEFTFRLSAFGIPVSPHRDLRAWYPVECTIQEMEAELAARAVGVSVSVKQEDMAVG